MLASCSFFISLALSEMFTDVEAFLEYLKVRQSCAVILLLLTERITAL